MGNLAKSRGDMYDWVSHTWTPLRGECPHHCSYCYVKDMGRHFPAVAKRYSGPVVVDEKDMVPIGSGNTIFVAHMTDLFAKEVPEEVICRVMGHCDDYPDNQYVFQTKNPKRLAEFAQILPADVLVGTTMESDRICSHTTNAPSVEDRANGLRELRDWDIPTFVTVEPIMAFDLCAFANLISRSLPDFVNIGADSGGHNLPEPTGQDILALIDKLAIRGIEVRQKSNLARLLNQKGAHVPH